MDPFSWNKKPSQTHLLEMDLIFGLLEFRLAQKTYSMARAHTGSCNSLGGLVELQMQSVHTTHR